MRPALIPGLSAIAERYDHVLLDQWGVLHDGRAIFPAARAAVGALGRAGKRVLVLSNSGKRAAENAARLARPGWRGSACRKMPMTASSPPARPAGSFSNAASCLPSIALGPAACW